MVQIEMVTFSGENLVPEPASKNETSPRVGAGEVAVRHGADVAAALRHPALSAAGAPGQLSTPPHVPRLPHQPLQPHAALAPDAGVLGTNVLANWGCPWTKKPTTKDLQ